MRKDHVRNARINKVGSKEKHSRPVNTSGKFAVVLLYALVLLITPWVIGNLVPTYSESGYTVTNNCGLQYTLFIGTGLLFSIINYLFSRYFFKARTQRKIFLLFEVVLLGSAGITTFLAYAVCNSHMLIL
jgi:hypothetical protein